MSADFLSLVREQLGESWVDDAPTPGPCPAWCVLPAGHPYESRPARSNGDCWTRYHVTASIEVELDDGGKVSFDVDAVEERVRDVVKVSPPTAAMYEPAVRLTVDDLSRVATAVIETRKRLMEVEG